jgi:UDP-N-acetylmuramoylalanine--D-glutamate ligase
MPVALTHLQDRRIGVFGLARSGLSTVRAAAAGGAAEVFAWDDKDSARKEAETLGARIKEPADWPWRDLDRLVLSPGVPLTHPKPHAVVELAQKADVGIVSDIELLWCETEGRARFVAITGTNGKSTTTALVGHVLSSAGLPACVGGNIGRPALDLDEPEDGCIYVLELSSYQLDLTRYLAPNVAVWLNLTPDHLDRHGDIAGYAKAKMRIFANMGEESTAVIGIDQPEMQAVEAELRRRKGPQLETVSVGMHADAALYVDPATADLFETGRKVASLAGLPTLRGAHNWQNAAMAFGAAKALDLDDETIMAGMATFPGLAHRMEIVARRGAVLFVNDSKATNADAAARALATFEPIYWIAGGQAKSGGIEPLRECLPRVAKAYLIGAAADAFSHTLAGRVPHVIAGDLDAAVPMAAEDAALDMRPEPTVLLSPACASFDQFSDFEARGEAFRRAVTGLDQPMEAPA